MNEFGVDRIKVEKALKPIRKGILYLARVKKCRVADVCSRGVTTNRVYSATTLRTKWHFYPVTFESHASKFRIADIPPEVDVAGNCYTYRHRGDGDVPPNKSIPYKTGIEKTFSDDKCRLHNVQYQSGRYDTATI